MVHHPDVESNDIILEQIPFNRSNSTQVTANRFKMKDLFDKYDTDNDGFLNLKEMKNLIRSQRTIDLPKGITGRLIKLGDKNGDRQLDFEEFWDLSLEHEIFFQKYLRSYCKHLVPRRQPSRMSDVVDGQYEDSMSCWPPPLTMVVFSIIEVIMFLIDVIYLKDTDTSGKIGQSVDGPAATIFIYNPYAREEVWRFATYMFVHVGVMHIVMNLIVQLFLGIALELVHSWWRVSFVYIAGVLAGSMGTSISDPHIFLAGASGGVYALITAHVATIILNWKEMEYGLVQLFVFLLFICIDLGSSIYNHVTNVDDKIGYIAHLCGAIAGLLVGIGALRNLKILPWERKLWWCAVTLYFALMLTGVCINIFHPEHFPRTR